MTKLCPFHKGGEPSVPFDYEGRTVTTVLNAVDDYGAVSDPGTFRSTGNAVASDATFTDSAGGFTGKEGKAIVIRGAGAKAKVSGFATTTDEEGTCQANGSATTIYLDSTDSYGKNNALEDALGWYAGMVIHITAGPGAGQWGVCTGYTPATQLANVRAGWHGGTTSPTTASDFCVRADLITTIASVNSDTSIELTDAPAVSMSGCDYYFITDNTEAIEAWIAACDATTKVGYLPAGTYFVQGVNKAIPTNAFLRGAGKTATTILFPDTKHYTGRYLFYNTSKTDIIVERMTFATPSIPVCARSYEIAFYVGDDCEDWYFNNMRFRGMYEGANLNGQDDHLVSNCTLNGIAMDNVQQPFFLDHCSYLNFTNLYLDCPKVSEADWDTQVVCQDPPHFFYVDEYVDHLTIDTATFEGGSHVVITDWSNDSYFTFRNLTLIDTCSSIDFYGVTNSVLEHVTATSALRTTGAWIRVMVGATVAVSNVNITSTSGGTDYLVYTTLSGAGSATFTDCSMTGCNEMDETPPGCLGTGFKPTYDSVTLNGTEYNYTP